MMLWDQHCALPLSPSADVADLLRFREIGAGFMSVNVGYAPNDADSTLAILKSFRRQLSDDERFLLAASAEDVLTAHAQDRLAVAFDLEDANPLDGRLDLVGRYHELGVRTLVPTYNYRNAAGSGCMDADDGGLTAYGRDLVREINRVGMVPDGSHCSARTGLDLCEVSTRPVVYSHSCMRSVWEHERNITDEQARARSTSASAPTSPSTPPTSTASSPRTRSCSPRVTGDGGRSASCRPRTSRLSRTRCPRAATPARRSGGSSAATSFVSRGNPGLDIDVGVKG
ncbi:membrane dipeptidase [Actinomadura sp. DC4]|nr:membrane dipeptidase [Actinomadura sp. DC4]MDN3352365.1 membrane dipeptidase [Actinomadura sp. DC4]